MDIINKNQYLKIEKLNEKTQKLINNIEYHSTLNITHLKHKLEIKIDSEIETQKKIWLIKKDKKFLEKNQKNIEINKLIIDSESDEFNIVELSENFQSKHPNYEDTIVYYFPVNDYNKIKFLEEKINNLKYLIDSHCELKMTHLNQNIYEGYKKLEEFNNNISKLEKQLNYINDLYKYIEIKLKIFELEIEKYNFLFYFHTTEYNSHYQ